jgi:hypothetical protein
VEENTGTVTADICFTITYNAIGKEPSKDCHLGLKPGEVSQPACSGCGFKNGSAKSIELTKYAPQ